MHTTHTGAINGTCATPATPAAPSRSLLLDGASNFRDLGGYAGLDGRPLAWRRIFRSDHLAQLSAADQLRLQTMGVAHAVDFRSERERAAQAYQLPRMTQYAWSIDPVVVHRTQHALATGHRLTVPEAQGLMCETYLSFVHEHAARFARLLTLLQKSSDPLVFHCTAGKDRTGWAAALILLALGVPRDVVMDDYLLTNTLYQRPPNVIAAASDGRFDPQVLDVLWGVEADFLNHALDAAVQDYGSLERYLAEVLGVDTAARKQLAQRYLVS
jgi:protein-tyrosine phosphatase